MHTQHPIGSGFGAATTTVEVIAGIQLTGKHAIVTGGYSGLGLETVRTLAAAGAEVIVPARDIARARHALNGIKGVEVVEMDLMDTNSIDRFAAQMLAAGRPLDLLINSAGIMATPLVRDGRGFESQFATNHLGHFQLTLRLWPALQRAGSARVVSVSSKGHRYSPVVFEDMMFERRAYDRWAAYGQSKTANILFAAELDLRGRTDGIRAFSLHPGSILGTGLERHLSMEELRQGGVLDEYGKPIRDPHRQLKTVEQGAATLVWCAISPQLDDRGGVYCENCDIASIMPAHGEGADMLNGSFVSGVLPYAIDPHAAARLWDVSEQLLGI